MNRKLVGTLAIAMVVGGYLSPVSAAPEAKSDYIVVFKDGVSKENAGKALGRASAIGDVDENGFATASLVTINSQQLGQLKKDASVKYVVENSVFTTQETATSWGLDRIDQATGLDSTFTLPTNPGTGVTVYIGDTGLSNVSGDFNGRMNTGCNSVNSRTTSASGCKSGGTLDDNGHGTHVAGTAAGSTFGIARAARITPVKMLDSRGSGTTSGIVAGLNWIIQNHQSGMPAVLNLSLGGGVNTYIDAAVNAVIGDGVTVVVAAGNSTKDACLTSPAHVPNAITVGATGNWNIDTNAQNDNIATYSNFGTCVDLFAPGTYIKSDGYKSATPVVKSGTSMASPHVTGVVALRLAKGLADMPLTVDAVLNAPANTTTKLLQSPTS